MATITKLVDYTTPVYAPIQPKRDAVYIMLWNNGVYYGKQNKTLFTIAELLNVFRKEMSFDAETIRVETGDDEFNQVSLIEFFKLLVRCGAQGDRLRVWEEDLAERGDDYVEISLVEANR